MGYTYEVNVWEGQGSSYNYVQLYAGNSLLKAVYNVWWAKRDGWKCIKLEYRR
jgi:hypothetical protein